MGFTLDGNFLISYKLIVEDGEGVNDSLHVYSLHWWRFNLNKPLRKVTGNLHLLISPTYSNNYNNYRYGVLTYFKGTVFKNHCNS